MSMVSRSPGGSTLIAWKRRSSERSFSMYLRYSAGVVAPMQRISPRDRAGLGRFAASGGAARAYAGDLAARQRRLEDVRRVERAFGRPRADERVQLVDEDDDVRVL